MTKKLFTEKQIGVAAIIGGPIPPGILFYLNYQRINKEKEAYISLVATLIFSIALFYTLIKLPQDIVDKIPNIAITACYGALVYFFYNRFLAKEINQKFEEGNEKASNWTVTFITILGFALTMLIIFAIAFNEPAFTGEKLLYGTTEHEIYYNETSTTPEDANKLGDALTSSGFFTDEYPAAVHLENWKTAYIVTLQIDKEFWEDQEVIDYLEEVKTTLEIAFQKEVTLVLEHYDLSGKKFEKRI